MWMILLGLGFLSGLITGLTSVGGGIVTTFLLLLLLPVFGYQYPMQSIATITTFHSIASLISGVFYYYRKKLIDKNLVIYFGVPSIATSYMASLIANQLSEQLLRGIFAALAIVAAVTMFFPNKERSNDEKFKKELSVLLSLGVGFIGGIMGVAAGFLYIPIFLYIFRTPIRVAVGSGMLVGLLLALGTLLGKIGTAYFVYDVALILVVGAIAGAQLGGRIGAMISNVWLKRVMATVICVISLKLLSEFVGEYLFSFLSM